MFSLPVLAVAAHLWAASQRWQCPSSARQEASQQTGRRFLCSSSTQQMLETAIKWVNCLPWWWRLNLPQSLSHKTLAVQQKESQDWWVHCREAHLERGVPAHALGRVLPAARPRAALPDRLLAPVGKAAALRLGDLPHRAEQQVLPVQKRSQRLHLPVHGPDPLRERPVSNVSHGALHVGRGHHDVQSPHRSRQETSGPHSMEAALPLTGSCTVCAAG